MCAHNVCKHLKGLDEGPQQDADGVTLPQKLDEPSSPEQPEEAQVQQPVLFDTDGASSAYQPNTIITIIDKHIISGRRVS